VITAGSASVQLEFPVYQDGTPLSLAGATVTLTLIDPQNNRTEGIALTVGSTNLTLSDGSTVAPNFWCYFATTATTFPISGVYQAQVVATFASNPVYSDSFNIPVGRKL